MTKKLGIPMFTKPTAGTQAANHPEGNAFYKNLVDIVTPEYDAISANGTGLVLGATNSLPLDTLIGGYITYQTGDLTVTQLQEGVDFTGATYTLVDDTYRWAYVNENPFSEADLTAIAEEPNKIVEFAMDGTGLINTQGVDDKFYGFRENSGAYCVDALAGYGVEECDTLIASYVDGANNTLSWDDATRTATVALLATSSSNRPNWQPGVSGGEIGKFYMFQHKVVVSSGIIPSMRVFAYDASGTGNINTKIYLNLAVGVHYLFTFGYLRTTYSTVAECDSTGFTEETHFTCQTSIREATASEIADYTDSIRTATANSQTSIQWTCAELDGAGVPTAYNSTPNTALMHNDTSISTNFKPNIGQYSIEETITGELAVLDVNGDPTGSFTQRTEARLLTVEDDGL